MKKVILGIFLSLLGVFIPMSFAYAGWDDPICSDPKISQMQKDAAGCSPSTTTAPNLAINLINVVIGVLGVVAAAFIVISGYRYTTAQGNPDTVAKARRGLIFSIVGLIVALLAFAIVNFVATSIA